MTALDLLVSILKLLDMGLWSNAPDSIVAFVVEFLFVGGILGGFGMALDLGTQHEAALNAFLTGGITPGGAVDFLLASPDRLLVFLSILLVAAYIVLFGETGGSTAG